MNLVCAVFISTWTSVLLQDGSTQYKNGHGDFQKEIRHNLFFIHLFGLREVKADAVKKNLSLSRVEHRLFSQ
jgi:hypothetical protein